VPEDRSADGTGMMPSTRTMMKATILLVPVLCGFDPPTDDSMAPVAPPAAIEPAMPAGYVETCFLVPVGIAGISAIAGLFTGMIALGMRPGNETTTRPGHGIEDAQDYRETRHRIALVADAFFVTSGITLAVGLVLVGPICTAVDACSSAQKSPVTVGRSGELVVKW
jgi:hypothetical protein